MAAVNEWRDKAAGGKGEGRAAIGTLAMKRLPVRRAERLLVPVSWETRGNGVEQSPQSHARTSVGTQATKSLPMRRPERLKIPVPWESEDRGAVELEESLK